jgi:hypothetical protein
MSIKVDTIGDNKRVLEDMPYIQRVNSLHFIVVHLQKKKKNLDNRVNYSQLSTFKTIGPLLIFFRADSIII